ncbi:hypothetical protein PPL_07660 [Heterostelium album PN500]|uniref:Ubiquitin-like domain-containing protein n=1 Tax=Heterostelium pallidum (strain ATCC 26659 / Pp 5 / PN500) TaxID=670386 RepID=D3BGK8_HETP5|nr:hypothetical protein PPL_07660 [Heterostelium album PN500]EFA79242.1 hypothetical protein PPL_07660 [Heterostelium album PN500]|eukprot:XP_020431363.1 hypothetical protein PPL_07660 [Heterostelium album PN500]
MSLLKLNFQTSAKTYWNQTFSEDATLNEMVKQLEETGKYQPNQNEYVLMYDDQVLTNRDQTLKELSVKNDDHFNLVDKKHYNSDKVLKLFVEKLDTQDTPIIFENLKHYQTIRSLIKEISALINVDASKLAIVYSGKRLNEYRTLSNSALCQGETLKLLILK